VSKLEVGRFRISVIFSVMFLNRVGFSVKETTDIFGNVLVIAKLWPVGRFAPSQCTTFTEYSGKRRVGVAIPDHFSIPGFRDWKTPIPGSRDSIPGLRVCKSGSIVEIRRRLH